MSNLKFKILLLFLPFISQLGNAQLSGLSGGLAFSSGVSFNNGKTGNPAFFGKAYLKINKKFHVVPSGSVFKKYVFNDLATGTSLETFMIHADIDGMYSLYHDKSKTFLGFAGINTTALFSKYNSVSATGTVSKSGFKPGLNLGGALELFINDSFDAYISLKYIAGPFSQGVINIGTIYYLGGKRRR